MSKGIDYGLGQTNINKDTGIRYGCISQNSVLQSWADNAECDYGKPSCPKCGNEISIYGVPIAMKILTRMSVNQSDGRLWCPDCNEDFDPDECQSENAVSHYFKDEEYQAVDCLDSDILILKSPFYTFAPFCSPCVPGAGCLDTPDLEGVKTYCFGHGWFEEQIAPYPVFRVSDDRRVIAELRPVECTYCQGLGFRSILELAAIQKGTVQETEDKIDEAFQVRPEAYKGHTLDRIAHTVTCWVCNGTGKRELVIEEVK